MQKRILSIFSPFLIAIIVRFIYALWGYGFFCAGYIANKMDWAKSNMNNIGFFDTFNWDVSWHYWGIVLVLTFLAEMDIWRDTKDDNSTYFGGHSIYGLIFLVIIVLFLIPSISSLIFAGGAWIFDILSRSGMPATVSSNLFGGCFTVIGLGSLISCWKHDRDLNEMNWIGIIMGVLLFAIAWLDIITPAFGYVVISIILCGIYFTACCVF